MGRPRLPKGLRRCKDCDRLCDDMIPPGWHGAHIRVIASQPRLANCQGRPLQGAIGLEELRRSVTEATR